MELMLVIDMTMVGYTFHHVQCLNIWTFSFKLRVSEIVKEGHKVRESESNSLMFKWTCTLISDATEMHLYS